MSNVEILNPDKDYLILVPINDAGEDELYTGEIFKDTYISNNLRYMSFHEEQYNYMESRLFDIINVELDVLINMYEEVIIENNRLHELMEIVNFLINNSDDSRFFQFSKELLNLLQLAKEHHTSVGFYF